MRKQLAALAVVMGTSMSLFTAPWAWSGTIEGRVSRGSSADLSNFVVSVEDIADPLQSPKNTAAEMNQQGLRFMPHVLAIQAGTTVDFPNSDPVSHNVFSISETKRFNLGLYGRGMKRTIRFDRPGVVDLLCNVHMEMSGYIVVLKNPYFAQTGTNGTYRIAGVPAGRHRMRCWHEQLPAQEEVIDVPSEGVVSVNFDMNSSPHENKNIRHHGEVSGR
jgi:plastocyanin